VGHELILDPHRAHRIQHRGRHLDFLVTAGGWEYVARRDRSHGVLVLAVTAERRLLLIEQLRPPLRARTIELPAGVIDKGETPRAAALRELQEETGYRARSVRPLFRGATCPGVTDDQNTICVAAGLRRMDDPGSDRQFPDGSRKHRQVRGVRGEDESLAVWEVPLPFLQQWLERRRSRGNIIDLRIYAGLYFLEQAVSSR
jgi:ADP-ribose pyrophosphatase